MQVLLVVFLANSHLQLIWRVNISLRRRMTLMLLFSGALFIMMAGIIRAVVISTVSSNPVVAKEILLANIETSLQSGPEGAVSGSQWACRETFVAIIVTNLPIIQPLLRKGASKIGLSALFSRSRPTNAESHQLQSQEPNGSRFGLGPRKNKGPHSHPLSLPQTTAWASDEQILPQDDKNGVGNSTGKDQSKGIVVTQEVGIRTDRMPENTDVDPAANDWGYGSVKRDPGFSS